MDVGDLYGLPLERFTPERNELAKRLRSQGARDEAARVAKLRKPSVAAWAVNQLVRTQKREINALFRAGDALQRAQAAVLAGKGEAGSLRQAAEAERAALDSLTVKARGLLSSEGHELSPAKLEQVSETLHAAAIDPEARGEVEDGCLRRELRHAGLGALGAGPTPRRRRRDDQRAARQKAAREAQAAAKRELRKAEQEVREAERQLAAARDRLDAANAGRDRARRALEEQ